jgi:hypothetical protein
MKKVALGCLIVVVIALIGFSVAGYYAYRWAQPMIQTTGDYVERARELARLDDRVQNKSTYTPPASNELTQVQVERYLAVQTRVRDELGARWKEIETKAADIQAKTKNNGRELTFAEFTSVLSDLAGIYTEARRAQVDALNVQRFSDDEYAWVRNRIYEAAGMEIASGIDLSRIQELARQGAAQSNVTIPDVPKPDVPEANIKLVRPHLEKLKESFGLAVLGL